MGKDRNSSFEILRIVAMLGIVFDQLSMHEVSVCFPLQ